ncbi:MAG: condensation domain-containing protein, partial [Actinomycetota bacterium]
MSTSETIDGGPGGVAGEPTGVTIELDIQSAGPTEEFPATALQAGMFFHAEANPGTGVDIEQISIEFDEPLDLPRFLEAWATVFRRHRILGSTFAWDASGRPITTIGHPFSLPVRVEDWRGEAAPVDTQTAEAAAERLIDFDLANGPLHRLVVAELSNGRWWVLWTFHHAILDGRSFPLVLREIFDRYDDGPSAAATARPDVGRFLRVIAEQDHGDGPAFWRRLLAGFETPNTLTVDRLLHHDRAVPPVAVLEHELGHEETAALRALAGETGCSLNTCIQAAWFLLLAHHTQQDFVTFGTTRACRHSVADAQDMVGLLINTVPLGLAVDDDETVGGLLQRLRDAQRALRAHETMPLPDIIEAVDAGPTLFDSIVVYDDASLDARMRAAGVAGPAGAASRRFHYDGQTNFPLTLLAYGDESLSIRLEYATDRYDEGFAAELLAHLRNLLVGLPAGLDRPAGNIGYLTMAEQEQ